MRDVVVELLVDPFPGEAPLPATVAELDRRDARQAAAERDRADVDHVVDHLRHVGLRADLGSRIQGQEIPRPHRGGGALRPLVRQRLRQPSLDVADGGGVIVQLAGVVAAQAGRDLAQVAVDGVEHAPPQHQPPPDIDAFPDREQLAVDASGSTAGYFSVAGPTYENDRRWLNPGFGNGSYWEARTASVRVSASQSLARIWSTRRAAAPRLAGQRHQLLAREQARESDVVLVADRPVEVVRHGDALDHVCLGREPVRCPRPVEEERVQDRRAHRGVRPEARLLRPVVLHQDDQAAGRRRVGRRERARQRRRERDGGQRLQRASSRVLHGVTSGAGRVVVRSTNAGSETSASSTSVTLASTLNPSPRVASSRQSTSVSPIAKRDS